MIPKEKDASNARKKNTIEELWLQLTKRGTFTFKCYHLTMTINHTQPTYICAVMMKWKSMVIMSMVARNEQRSSSIQHIECVWIEVVIFFLEEASHGAFMHVQRVWVNLFIGTFECAFIVASLYAISSEIILNVTSVI